MQKNNQKHSRGARRGTAPPTDPPPRLFCLVLLLYLSILQSFLPRSLNSLLQKKKNQGHRGGLEGISALCIIPILSFYFGGGRVSGKATDGQTDRRTTRDRPPQVPCVNSSLHDRSLIIGFPPPLPPLPPCHCTYHCMVPSVSMMTFVVLLLWWSLNIIFEGYYKIFKLGDVSSVLHKVILECYRPPASLIFYICRNI